MRGQRVYCSRRGRRGGCGRTFPIFRSEVLPRHSLPASLLWRLLVALLANTSVKAVAESLRLPLALESVYHLLQRLRRRLDQLRTGLCRRSPAPASSQSDPLRQTVEHLRAVFTDALVPVSEYQCAFQQSFLG